MYRENLLVECNSPFFMIEQCVAAFGGSSVTNEIAEANGIIVIGSAYESVFFVVSINMLKGICCFSA